MYGQIRNSVADSQTYEPVRVRCITNRHLSVQDYGTQIRQIAQAGPEALIVREKDLPEEAYEQLAIQVMEICAQYGVFCILHTYADVAVRLHADGLHLPLHLLLTMPEEQKTKIPVLGASVHSVQEALQAQKAGAAYLTAGHVYETDCKRGMPARGLSFLREVCQAVPDLPVYALGGICAENAADCIRAGAHGVCIMSECMRQNQMVERLRQYRIGGR